jgi:large subunit ribosomal protein L14e
VNHHPGPVPGSLVRSTAGRDLGHCYVLIAVLDERRVLVADGEVRTVVRPKVKNLRHLEVLPQRNEALVQRLAEGQRVRDDEVLQTLRSFGFRRERRIVADADRRAGQHRDSAHKGHGGE